MSYAIVSTMLHPGESLSTWLEHHIALGFERFYLFLDDAEDPARAITARFSQVRVFSTGAELLARQRTHRLFSAMAPYLDAPEPSCKIQRILAQQTLNAETAIQEANAEGIRWLLHIDSDELFYTSRPSAAPHFEALERSEISQCLYVNHEAVPLTEEVVDPFREVSLFKRNPRLRAPSATPDARPAAKFIAYRIGKSAARVQPDLLPHGMHRFSYPARGRMACSADPCILHFPSCGFSRYREKYHFLGSFSDFPFGLRPTNLQPNFNTRSRELALNGDVDGMRAFYRREVMLSDADIDGCLAEGLLFRVEGGAAR